MAGLVSHIGILMKPGSSGGSGLIDVYYGAQGAFSFSRRLRDAYAGPLFRVVTSAAGNAELDIGVDAFGNVDETALSAFIGANTGTVKTVYDQSNTSLDATQATISKQPVIVTAGTLNKINGRLVALGNGTSTIMLSPFNITGLTSKQSTLAVVQRSTSTAPAGSNCVGVRRTGGYTYQSGVSFGRRTNRLAHAFGSGSVAAFSFSLFQNNDAPNPNITDLVEALLFNNGPSGIRAMYVDGAPQTMTNVNGTMSITGFQSTSGTNHQINLFGELDLPGAEGGWWPGYLAEAVFWPSDLTVNRQGIKTNQAVYYKTPGSYYASVMEDGPTCYWRMGETGATTVATDVTPNLKHGTYKRNASTDTIAGLLVGEGDTNAAINFPNSNANPSPQGITIATNPVNTSTNFTVTAIVKPTAVAAAGGIGVIANLGGAPNCPELAIEDQGGGVYKFRVMLGGASVLFKSTASYAYNVKHHVVMRRTTNLIELFVDGVADGSATNAYAVASSTTRVGFGSYAGIEGYNFPGIIDEVAFFQSSLSNARIAAHVTAI